MTTYTIYVKLVFRVFSSCFVSKLKHEQMKINVLRLPTAKLSVISIYKEGQPLKNFNLETFSFALNPQRVINHVFLIIKLSHSGNHYIRH